MTPLGFGEPFHILTPLSASSMIFPANDDPSMASLGDFSAMWTMTPFDLGKYRSVRPDS